MTLNSKRIVRKGYNRISRWYRTDDGKGLDAQNMRPWIEAINQRLPKGSRVLELGCGMGVPVAKFFAKKHDFLGVDISDAQIRRAKKLVPKGRFSRSDMTKLKFERSSFDVVFSFYALIHLPLREQKPLLKRVYKWLRPGGLFEATLGWNRWTGRSEDWHGTEMFWSHADRETYGQWLKEAGFRVLRQKLIREGRSGHVLFLCRKPKA